MPVTSVAKDCTVKSWLALFQTTLGLLLVQALAKQVGGLEEPEVVSPKAAIVVGV